MKATRLSDGLGVARSVRMTNSVSLPARFNGRLLMTPADSTPGESRDFGKQPGIEAPAVFLGIAFHSQVK